MMCIISDSLQNIKDPAITFGWVRDIPPLLLPTGKHKPCGVTATEASITAARWGSVAGSSITLEKRGAPNWQLSPPSFCRDATLKSQCKAARCQLLNKSHLCLSQTARFLCIRKETAALYFFSWKLSRHWARVPNSRQDDGADPPQARSSEVFSGPVLSLSVQHVFLW